MMLFSLVLITITVLCFIGVYAKNIGTILKGSKSQCNDVDTVLCFHCVAVVVIMMTYLFIMAGTLSTAIAVKSEQLQFEYGVHESQLEVQG